jgi:hypothetical protein
MNLLGLEECLLSYADDIYMGDTPPNIAHTLIDVLDIYGAVDLMLGWGPKKTISSSSQLIATLMTSFYPKTCETSPSQIMCRASRPASDYLDTLRPTRTSS